MSYGGVDEVEMDEIHGRYYVHRQTELGGYWDTYSIKDDSDFLEWLKSYKEKPDKFYGTVGFIPFYRSESNISQEEKQDDPFKKWGW